MLSLKKHVNSIYAHNRRNYYNIMKSVKKEGVAKHIVMEYKKLYAIEDYIKGLPPSLIQSYRTEHSLPNVSLFNQPLWINLS